MSSVITFTGRHALKGKPEAQTTIPVWSYRNSGAPSGDFLFVSLQGLRWADAAGIGPLDYVFLEPGDELPLHAWPAGEPRPVRRELVVVAEDGLVQTEHVYVVSNGPVFVDRPKPERP